jgi:hypothetical protein
MKTLELSQAHVSLEDAVRSLGKEPLAVLLDGRPVAVLFPAGGSDLETLSLSFDAKFMAILERSRRRHEREGGLSSEEMRRRLDASVPARPAKKNGRTSTARKR